MLLIVSMSAMVISLAGCPKRVTIPGKGTASAALADIRFQKDDNKNTIIDLRVSHLAPMKRIGQDSVYVVWTANPETRNLSQQGSISVGEDRTGSLRFTTPSSRFLLLITIEQRENLKMGLLTAPMGEIIFESAIDGSQ